MRGAWLCIVAALSCRKADPHATPRVPSGDATGTARTDAAPLAIIDATAANVTATPDTSVDAAPAAPPFTGTTAYQGLVTPGAKWTFRYKSDTRSADLPDETRFGRHAPTFECGVETAASFANGRGAWILCGDGSDNSRNPMVETWADTPHGLYVVETLPEPGEALTLDDDGLFLAASPVEREDGPDEDDPNSGTHRIQARGDAWCVTDIGGGDYAEGSRLCLDARGPVSGYWYYEDLYNFHVTYFERVDGKPAAKPTPTPR